MSETSGSPLGGFIRERRQLAHLTLREMARLTRISNAYLSQVERGLHEPSIRVLRAVSDALGIPFEELVGRAGTARVPRSADRDAPTASTVEEAIRHEPRLSTAQKEALLSVFRGFLEVAEDGQADPRGPRSAG